MHVKRRLKFGEIPPGGAVKGFAVTEDQYREIFQNVVGASSQVQTRIVGGGIDARDPDAAALLSEARERLDNGEKPEGFTRRVEDLSQQLHQDL